MYPKWRATVQQHVYRQEIAMVKICPNCGLENIAARTICKRCQAALEPQQSSAAEHIPANQASMRSFMTVDFSPAYSLGWQDHLRIWIAWTLATTLSAAVIAGLQQASSCANFILAFLFLPVLFAAGIGLGAVQWLVLRHP